MDTTASQHIDAIKEAELEAGHKVVVVPASVRAALVRDGLPDLPAVRLVRMNPRRRRDAAVLVQKRYMVDMLDDALPSEAQMKELAAKRGEWTPVHDAERKQLGEESQQLMLGLYSDGFGEGAERWATRIDELSAQLRAAMPDAEDGEPHSMREVFETWRAWVSEQPGNDPAYNPDRALQQLYNAFPTFGDALSELDDLKDRVNRYWKLVRVRTKLNELELRRARVFDQTVESRRDQVEEYARLYATTTRLDAFGNDAGPLTADFDALWDLPFDALSFLTTEAYLFSNGIADEARKYLETWGFLVPTLPDSPKPDSDASPDVGTHNSDGSVAGATPATTSASVAPQG